MEERLEMKIYGRVQGVFYRAKTRAKADSLNLKGYVKNNDDGTVTVVAEGKKSRLQLLLEWCREGPTLAHVEQIESEWKEAEGKFLSFNVKY